MVICDQSLGDEQKAFCKAVIHEAIDLLGVDFAYLASYNIFFSHIGSYYICKEDMIYIQVVNDKEYMLNAIIHEIGHRIHLKKMSLWKKHLVLWKFIFSGVNSKWFPNSYSKRSPFEMFAEIFRLYVRRMTCESHSKWINKLIKTEFHK